MGDCFIGIDVGTGSARAGLFDSTGLLLASASCAIQIWRTQPSHAEQSSRDIWQAICKAVRTARADAGVPSERIAGIGFDATCSLVLLDGTGQPVAVNQDGLDERNIILWMDQRATTEAEEINQTGARVLDYVGGRISPEMETPKLLWLSRHLPESMARATHLFDLADFLTWKATGSLSRSTCTMTCKWTFLAHENTWDDAYFDRIGLGALKADGYVRIGKTIEVPGTPLGSGLTDEAAHDLGLLSGTPVGTGIIDAHAGAIGTIGAKGLPGTLNQRLAYVFGTSACTLNVTSQPVFVPGVWGPYYAALLPGMWLNEGGQSAAGAALDHLVLLHPHAPEASRCAAAEGQGLTQWLDARAQALLAETSLTDAIAGLHIVPEFLGNRAPLADPKARGIIAGLGLEADEASLVRLYLAGLVSVGYGLRQILEALRAQHTEISTVVVSGGAARSPLVRRLLADAAGIAIATVNTDEPVLLGSAILAAVAAGRAASVQQAMTDMSEVKEVIHPNAASAPIHARRYQAFLALQSAYRDLRRLDEEAVL